ncbi:calcium-binding protein [Microvirga sp. TS319]|uniref:calcium-binding protein n=1 Tax=Microvirga sp. TS319 TaxID=3241165 RepID=UPI00351A8AE4
MILSSQGKPYPHQPLSVDLTYRWAIPVWAAKQAAVIESDGSAIDGELAGQPSVTDYPYPPYTSWLILGSDLAESLVGRSAGIYERDTMYGRGGNDTMDGGDGNDLMWGDDDNDILYGGPGGDYVDGGNGDDQLDGGADGDFLTGWTGHDTLAGGLNNDQLYGCAGNDILIGGQGADTLYGGLDATDGAEGMDTVSYATSASGVFVNLAEGRGLNGDAEGDRIYGVENLVGSVFGDYLVGQDVANRWGTFFDASYYLNKNPDLLAAFGAGNVAAATAHWWDLGHTEARRYAIFVTGSQIDAGDGDDIVYGGGQDDYLLAGAGADNVSGQFGNDWIYGETGNDRLEGGVGDDRLYGGDDEDTLIGGSGADYLHGGIGFDSVSYAQAQAGVIVNLATGGTAGEAAGDTYVDIEQVEGTAYADTLVGNGMGNELVGGAGGDGLYGDRGNDSLEGGLGSDILDGGEEFDLAIYINANSGVNASLFRGSGESRIGGDSDTYRSIEGIVGSNFFDILEGDRNPNYLAGLSGTDYLEGREGNDTLDGGLHDDTLEGGTGADFLDGGVGEDTAIYDHAFEGIVASLETGGSGGEAAGDVFINIENLEGTFRFGDRLSGNSGGNKIYGWGGEDVLSGLGGNDQLFGGTDNDRLEGGLGADRLDGGDGIDTAIYAQSNAAVYVNLATGSGMGDAAGDILVSIENIEGTAFGDTLIGSDGANTLLGGAGNDTLDGGMGGDRLDGGRGIDTVSFVHATEGVTVSLDYGGTRGEAAGDRYLGIEYIEGSNFGDDLMADEGNNALYGLDGSDFLYGFDGEDTLDGGDGNDYLYGDSRGGDSLGDTLYGGQGDDYLIGGNGKDYLDGGDGNDWLSGAGLPPIDPGPPGKNPDPEERPGTDYDADVLIGGAGRDMVSYMASTKFVWTSLATGGTQNSAEGDVYGDIEDLQGTNFDDRLGGDAGDNALYGMDGADILTGGAGRDAFVFMGVLDGYNIDQITDYTVGEDKIHLFWGMFEGLGMGPLAANAFVVGSAATQNEHRIIYNAATGALSFDADGSGAGAAIQFATLTANLPLSANDFLVIDW